MPPYQWQECIFEFTCPRPTTLRGLQYLLSLKGPPSLDDQLVIFDNSLHPYNNHLASDISGSSSNFKLEFTQPPSNTPPKSFSNSTSQTITLHIIYKQLGQALAPFPNDLNAILAKIPGSNCLVVSVHVWNRNTMVLLNNAVLLGITNISTVSPRDTGTRRQKTAIGDEASRCSPRGKKPIAYGWAGGKQELIPYGPAGTNLARLSWCGFSIKCGYRDSFGDQALALA